MAKENINEDFTDQGDVTDEDVIAIQIYLTPDRNIKVEVNEQLVTDEETGEMLSEKEALSATLAILRPALFTLTKEYIDEYGIELDDDTDPSFFEEKAN